MRTFALAAGLAAVAAGCASCGGGPASARVEVPKELRHTTRAVPPIPDRYPYGDVARVKVGQWARYREGGRTFTLAAVGKEGDAVRVESVEEGEERQVTSMLVAPDGVVKKAFYREITKEGPSEVVPQPLEQAAPRTSRPPEGARDAGEEKVTVGERELTARRVRVRTETLEGRIVEEVTLWHPDVPPLYAGSADGGLVLRRSGSSELRLLDFGTDAKPLVPPAP